MVIPRNGRAGGSLGPYVACAAAIHAALFALSSLRPAQAAAAPEASAISSTVSVDVDPVTPDPPAMPPGGGTPTAGDLTVATAVPPVPTAPRKPKTVAPELVSADNSPSGLAAAQAADERRQRDIARGAAAAAAGLGAGARGGPGGGGAGWSGAPAIRGSNAFGNGSRGALTGRVCFLPEGTLRIADVRDCRYVATVYADRLDIPERHFSDGFPGVTNRSDWFLIDYTGTFSVTGYGTYVFRLHSDDGSYLYIDDALVIENDGKHAPESRTGRVQLSVGEHRIKVRYAQTTDRMALQLFVRNPQGNESIFTTQL